MIDKKKLEESFQIIGKGRIPYYINLYFKNNREFAVKANRLYRNNRWTDLTSLLHKTRGSFSIFQANELACSFIDLEKYADQNPQAITNEEIGGLLKKYNDFCSELKTIRQEYMRSSEKK
ncbi:MAG: hypothetical protein K9N06_09935 [Candidatus Cloacimonetes bacterium]|nr:hypothetical protein [Candidatus Cloacimonadota bacterium]